MRVRYDLLDAVATIEWAETNFLGFEQRLNSWIDDNVYVETRDGGVGSFYDFIVLVKRTPLPLTFNAEFGAYINAIRSSLDMLAIALAKRNGTSNLRDVCFPIARSSVDFARSKHWKKLKEVISTSDEQSIEAIKPYADGNELLWQLHRMDITRKHHRLLSISIDAAGIAYTPGIPHGDSEHRRDRLPPETDLETVHCAIRKGAPKQSFKFVAEAFVREPDFRIERSASKVLTSFSGLAHSIIQKFY